MPRLSPLFRWTFFVAMVVLAVSGVGQMPIFKRYYVADLPGMGWMADFFVTHLLHYLGAIVFLALTGYLLTRYLAAWRERFAFTPLGAWRVAVYAGLVLTGGMRILKNLTWFHFGPVTTMVIDWTHLFLAFVLGVLALMAAVRGARYLRERSGAPRREGFAPSGHTSRA